jgi:hypothetical protein
VLSEVAAFWFIERILRAALHRRNHTFVTKQQINLLASVPIDEFQSELKTANRPTLGHEQLEQFPIKRWSEVYQNNSTRKLTLGEL